MIEDNILFGMLTIDGANCGKTKLSIPNQVVQIQALRTKAIEQANRNESGTAAYRSYSTA